jgi:hypothetical protein
MKAESIEQLKSLPLDEASVQEIQLELIRRRRFHAFDGQRVAAKLLECRDLWDAVMMDRIAISNPGKLPSLSMVKLRDLPDDEWNVDTLYILSRDKPAAQQLAQLFDMETWGGMVSVHDDQDDVDSALGGCRDEKAVVAIWWD